MARPAFSPAWRSCWAIRTAARPLNFGGNKSMRWSKATDATCPPSCPAKAGAAPRQFIRAAQRCRFDRLARPVIPIAKILRCVSRCPPKRVLFTWITQQSLEGAEKIAPPLLAALFSHFLRIRSGIDRENRTARGGCATQALLLFSIFLRFDCSFLA
jgi:hypothetical protein